MKLIRDESKALLGPMVNNDRGRGVRNYLFKAGKKAGDFVDRVDFRSYAIILGTVGKRRKLSNELIDNVIGILYL